MASWHHRSVRLEMVAELRVPRRLVVLLLVGRLLVRRHLAALLDEPEVCPQTVPEAAALR